jgi:hypothetical protein
MLGPVATGILALFGTAFIYFLAKIWKARSIFVEWGKQGLVSGSLIIYTAKLTRAVANGQT